MILGKRIISPLQRINNQWIKILMPFGIYNGLVKGKAIKGKV
jgi:hypothetical protein